MNIFKGFIIIVFTALGGIFLGIYIYKSSKISTKEVFYENNSVYLMQYGVYSNENVMKDSAVSLSDYFYYKDKDGYHVIIGVIENKNIGNKIRDSYDIKDNIYYKEVKINNMEFLQSLRQYDSLVSSLNDKTSIINAEKQILSKYEELILNNEYSY